MPASLGSMFITVQEIQPAEVCREVQHLLCAHCVTMASLLVQVCISHKQLMAYGTSRVAPHKTLAQQLFTNRAGFHCETNLQSASGPC